MCTGFIFKGEKTLFAYNLDISPKDFDYRFIINDEIFTVCIQLGSTKYFTHGVNKNGVFCVLPFMNDSKKYCSKKHKRIDLVVDNLLKNKLLIDDVKKMDDTSNIEFGSLHAIMGDKKEQYLVEPGLGKRLVDKYQVISNYPLLKEVNDNNPFYGRYRYSLIEKQLSELDDLPIDGAMNLLKQTSQDGEYSTKLSFVYSIDENKVYYCFDRDFDNILVHVFPSN